MPHNPLELLKVPVLVYGVHGVHELLPEQPPVLADLFDEPNDSLGLINVYVMTVMSGCQLASIQNNRLKSNF